MIANYNIQLLYLRIDSTAMQSIPINQKKKQFTIIIYHYFSSVFPSFLEVTPVTCHPVPRPDQGAYFLGATAPAAPPGSTGFWASWGNGAYGKGVLIYKLCSIVDKYIICVYI
jgi:hypothetical protein